MVQEMKEILPIVFPNHLYTYSSEIQEGPPNTTVHQWKGRKKD